MISVPILPASRPARSPSAILTGEPFDAEFAREIGLVTHVATTCRRRIDTLCEGGPLGLATGDRRHQAARCGSCPTLDRNTALAEMGRSA